MRAGVGNLKKEEEEEEEEVVEEEDMRQQKGSKQASKQDRMAGKNTEEGMKWKQASKNKTDTMEMKNCFALRVLRIMETKQGRTKEEGVCVGSKRCCFE